MCKTGDKLRAALVKRGLMPKIGSAKVKTKKQAVMDKIRRLEMGLDK